MTGWLVFFFIVFVVLLAWASLKSYHKGRTSGEFILAGKNIGALLGFLSFAAALFSAFTFLGMPDFFRVHGLGAWIFLAFSDAVMVFFMLWFAYKLRRKAVAVGYEGVSGMLAASFGTRWAGLLFLITAFIFLVPYAAIQIRGISIFLDAAVPNTLPDWSWSLIIVIMMLVYAEVGGLKAIMFSDAVQGLLLLVVIWAIALSCIHLTGGLRNTFETAREVSPALVTLPGPKGLFTAQFLIVSTIAITMIPVTQPQMTTRLVVIRNLSAVHRMAYSVGFFAMIVILPTAFIGMYGAIRYSETTTADFIAGALLHDQPTVVGALAVVGLFAACLSTTNAQIFALGSELRSLLRGEDRTVMRYTRMAILCFSLLVLLFSVYMSDQLALLARVSFTGTSMMAPVVISAVLFARPPRVLLVSSLIALVLFLFLIAGFLPASWGGVSAELLLYIVHAAFTVIVCLSKKRHEG